MVIKTIMFQRARTGYSRAMTPVTFERQCDWLRIVYTAPPRSHGLARAFAGSAAGAAGCRQGFHPLLWLSRAMDGTTADGNPTSRNPQSSNHRNSKSSTVQPALGHAAKLFAEDRVLSAFSPSVSIVPDKLEMEQRDGR